MFGHRLTKLQVTREQIKFKGSMYKKQQAVNPIFLLTHMVIDEGEISV
jgi:hypothetical protein